MNRDNLITVLKSIDNGTKTVTNGVFCLIQSVLVGAFDQDGNTQWVLAVLDERVLVFSLLTVALDTSN